MDLSAFYGAFSPACFALLGLWLVAVQVRLPTWENDPERRRRSYGVALYFALPGMMSVLALIDTQTSVFWRVSFGIVAVSGVVVMVTVRGCPVPREPGQAGVRAASRRRPARPGRLPGGDRALRPYRGAGRAGRAVRAAHRGGAADPAGLPRVQRGVAAVAGRQEARARLVLG